MMKEVEHDDQEVVSLLEDQEDADGKPAASRNYGNLSTRRQFIATKLFYFLFFAAQGSLMPYLALYYKQLRLTAAETGIVSGATMYIAVLIIPLWSMHVDKFKVGKLVFLMSTTALMVKMLTISMAPADVCEVEHEKMTKERSTLNSDLPNGPPYSNYSAVGLQHFGLVSRDVSDQAVPFVQPLTLAINGSDYSHFNLFLFLLLVTIGGTIVSCPCLSLVDTATVELLARNSETHNYGRQRLWGSIGNGLASFIVGASISKTNLCPEGEKQVNYYLCFYIYAVFLFFAIIVGSRLQFNSKTESSPHNTGSSRIFSTLRHVIVNANYIIFLITVFFDGVAMSFIKTFLFWFLKDFGGTQFLFSVMSAVNCSIEVLMYFLSSVFIKRFGSIRVIFVALLCYAARFFFYAFVQNPWLVLAIEPLSGITTAALWSAIMSHVGVTAMKESVVTLQGNLSCKL